MKQNRLLYSVALAIVCWALYTATFDSSGNFDPTSDFDVVEYRIGSKLGMVATSANRSIEETNQGMQDVADGRNQRNRKHIQRDVQSDK